MALIIRSGNQIEENEMGRACGTYGGGEINTDFWWRNLKERDHLEDLGVDLSMVINYILKKWNGRWGGGGVELINLFQDRKGSCEDGSERSQSA
jgi:hypothetical protein